MNILTSKARGKGMILFYPFVITDNVHCMSVVGGRLDFVCVNVGLSERREERRPGE